MLLGPDAVGLLAVDQPFMRRADVAIVSDRENPTIWRDAVTTGADRVILLPAGQDDLVSWLADTVDGVAQARVIAVVGARGGVGASTFATSLAVCAARAGPVCLIDADPLSGGLELVLGSEDVEGLRWPEVSLSQGRFSASALRTALPNHRGVTLLSWSRGAASPVSATTMRSMVGAAGRSFADVVLDLPRVLDPAAVEAVAAAGHVLLVATNDVRSAAAASVLVPLVRAYAPDVSVVVRTTRAGAAAPETFAAAVRLRLAGTVPTRRSVTRSIDEGCGPPGRGVLMRRCGEILAGLRQPDPR